MADMAKLLMVEGTILENLSGNASLPPRLGVWIMPNNTTSGAIEELLAFLVPQKRQPLLEHVKASVATIPAEYRLFKDEPKAVIHTWLAWQEIPGLPMGLAVKSRFFDIELPEAKALIAWLNRLFACCDATKQQPSPRGE